MHRVAKSWLGWKDYSAPLRCVPCPLGRPPVVILPPPQNAKSPPPGELLRCVAGVEGFEPPNGGIKTRGLTTWLRPNTLFFRKFSNLLACALDWVFPSSPPDSPSLPPKLPLESLWTLRHTHFSLA